MAHLIQFVRRLLAALAALSMISLPAIAQPLESGDIVVPGNVVVDGFGNVNGCFYRLRNGAVTRLFQSGLYRHPKDMIVDSQGRLVFFASTSGRNVNDFALFRIDPATASLERLYYFPYIVQPGDTLPQGAGMITQFPYGSHNQSLHFERTFDVKLDDDVNGGWPEVIRHDTYAFSSLTFAASGLPPTTFLYDPIEGVCKVGISTSLLPGTGAPCMISDDEYIYYGSSRTIGRTSVPTTVQLHFDGDWGALAITGTLPPKNVLIITGSVLDNTRDPNGTVNCGAAIDNNVPFNPSGASFASLSMSGLGLLGGAIYVTSSSSGTGTPFVFDIATRDPYLNPFSCQWLSATIGTGPLGFWLPDFTPTSASRTSPDGDGLLGVGNGRLIRTDRNGLFEVLDASQPYTGRPWRWNGPSSVALTTTTSSDSGAQVLVVRSDSLVNVLLTDADGRRIGHDASGNPINDFGASGQALSAGASGWPRLIMLRDPKGGTFSAEISSSEAGDWWVKSYLAHASGGGQVTTTTGSAAGAGSEMRGLHVGQPTELAWYASPLGVGDRTGAEQAGFISIGPVPARGEVRLAYRVPATGGNVRLEIFDLAGRSVAAPVRSFHSGGAHQLTWRGETRSGARLSHGIYVVRLDVDGRRETRRIVLTN